MKGSPKIIFIITSAAIAGIFLFSLKNIDLVKREINDILIPEIKNIKDDIEKKIKTAPPLRVIKETVLSKELKSEKIIEATNTARIENNLIALKVDEMLNQASQNKVEDMFEKQYFEHIGPDGRNVINWANDSGYEYISIGENLALGNFEDEEDLLRAWLESPGHRENILNTGFTEIGVAAKQGFFEGKKTWLAVQIFARPSSDCLKPNAENKNNIIVTEERLDKIKKEIDTLSVEIENSEKKWGASYNEMVRSFNLLVEEYNSLIETLKVQIEKYNIEVNYFNSCLESS